MKTYPIYLNKICCFCGQHVGLTYNYKVRFGLIDGFNGLYVRCSCDSAIYVPTKKGAKYAAFNGSASS